MSHVADWRTGWAKTHQITTSPQAATYYGAALAVLALAEASLRAALTATSSQATLVLCLLALATTLPLAALPPPAAAIATSAATLLSLGLLHTLTIAGAVALLIDLYRSANNTPRLLPLGLAVPFVALALAGPNPTASEGAMLGMLLAALAPAAALTGIAANAKREARLERTAREAIADDLLEHTARGERARIARELHDIVAHHISMIAVQAETARVTTPGMPDAGAHQLSAIGDTARSALTDMRRLVGVLREDTGDEDVALLRHPQPDLRQLIDLLDTSRAATRATTRLIISGPPVALDPGTELAAYRIAQEALTNTRRHAPGAAVDVELHYSPHALQLRVRDNGPGPTLDPSAGRHGLTGMRERAAAAGGTLRTGPAPGGGFLLEASFPTGKAQTQL